MKSIFRNYALVIFISLIKIASIFAQDQSKVSIIAPEVASFAKYGNIPVSTYTGVPNISIPIFTVQDGPLVIPITLSYHASGIKVEEEATWVGLGWDLSTGGMITRAIRGKDDLLNNGDDYLNSNSNKPLFDNGSGCGGAFYLQRMKTDLGKFSYDVTQRILLNPEYLLNNKNGTRDYVDDIYFNKPDWQPDLFYFNAGNNSGKFVFDDDNLPMLLKKSDIKITFDRANKIFIITSEEGIKYSFEKKDVVATSSTPPKAILDNISTWYLTKITSANNLNVIDLIYEDSEMNTNEISSFFNTVGSNGSVSPTVTKYKSRIDYKYLSEIRFRGGKVVFSSSEGRTDLSGARQLDSVSVYNNQNIQVYKASFAYSYFMSTETSDPKINNRLRLDKIYINDDLANPYVFEYNNENVPSKQSGQDYWGYTNRSGYDIPRCLYKFVVNGVESCGYYGSGDYNPSWPLTQAFSLNKVTYPTKGYSKYIYEPNEFSNIPECFQYDVSLPLPPRTILTYEKSYINGDWKNFTVNMEDGGAEFKCSFQCLTGSLSSGMSFQIYNVADPSESYSISVDDPTKFTKTQVSSYTNYEGNVKFSKTLIGDYKIKSYCSSLPELYYWNTSVQAIAIPPSTLVSKNLKKKSGGGIRIKEIVNNDGKGETTFKKYEYGADASTTWGKIMSFPNYFTYLPDIHANGVINMSFSSKSTIGLSTEAGGSYVGYDTIKEIHGTSSGNENGYILYEYSNLPDVIPAKPEIGMPNFRDAENGLLRNKTIFTKDSKVVSKIINVYSSFDMNWKNTTGVCPEVYSVEQNLTNQYSYQVFGMCKTNLLAGGFSISLPLFATIGYQNYQGLYIGNTNYLNCNLYFYKDYQCDFKLLKQIERDYGVNDQTKYVEKVTDYEYNLGISPKKVTLTNSKNEKFVSEYRYSYDFSSTASFISAMKDANILNQPIEVVTFKIGTNSNSAVGGMINEYGTGNKNGLLIRKYTLNSNTPINWSDANFSNFLSGSTFVYDSNYSLEKSFDYSNGNLIQANKTNDINTSYIWGYNQSYPVVKAANLSYDNLNNVILQSLSGVGYSSINALLTDITSFPNSAWTIFNTNLRRNAPNALFTTYTYKPLIGMTTQTDPNGITTYYEYDEFGRLKLIKDQDGNIMKTYDYHYKDQQ